MLLLLLVIISGVASLSCSNNRCFSTLQELSAAILKPNVNIIYISSVPQHGSTSVTKKDMVARLCMDKDSVTSISPITLRNNGIKRTLHINIMPLCDHLYVDVRHEGLFMDIKVTNISISGLIIGRSTRSLNPFIRVRNTNNIIDNVYLSNTYNNGTVYPLIFDTSDSGSVLSLINVTVNCPISCDNQAIYIADCSGNMSALNYTILHRMVTACTIHTDKSSWDVSFIGIEGKFIYHYADTSLASFDGWCASIAIAASVVAGISIIAVIFTIIEVNHNKSISK